MVRGTMNAGGTEFLSMPVEGVQSASQSEPQVVTIQPIPASRNWLRLMLAAAGVAGGLSGGALLWLFSIPPAPNCDQISLLTSDMERLYCIQESARSGELPSLLAGLRLLGEWTPDHPLYKESQRLMGEWSQAVLTAADRRVEQNDLNGAIELASQIPQTSPVYRDAQKTIATWRQQWRQAEALYTDAQKAIQQQDWGLASQKISALRLLSDSYWRLQQANTLVQQLQEERRARKTLAQALHLASSGKVEDLARALTLVGEIRSNTYTWADVKPDLKKWSQAVLAFGFQQWQGGKLDQAVWLAQTASLNPDLADDAEHLKWLSQARRLALASSSNWRATPAQILQLMTATTIASYIPANSQFYQPAQTTLKQWRAQLEDVSQLQVAQLAANLSHPFTLEFAMDQATQVASDRPRRLQAQTLVAHWRVELERIEDQPLIASAHEFADKGSIPSLKSAIDQVRQIKRGRALYPQAQTLIAGWNRQIQTLEDQPILRVARLKAEQGLLNEAIQVASTIQSGRSLYWQAQNAIAGWLTEMRQAQLARQRAFTVPGASSSAQIQPVTTRAILEPEVQPVPLVDLPPSELVPAQEATTSPLPASVPTFTPAAEPTTPSVPVAPVPAAEITTPTAPVSPSQPASEPATHPVAAPSSPAAEPLPASVLPTPPNEPSGAPVSHGGAGQALESVSTTP